MKALYIAWQDSKTRRWYTVGRLSRENGHYRFGYTRGAEMASPHFGCLGRMEDLYRFYYSPELFPTFANRLLNTSRPEYPDYLTWMGMDGITGEKDKMELLARSGGHRATDQFCIYPEVEPNEQGEMVLHFFSHGLRHLSPAGKVAIGRLKLNEPLQLTPEDDNPHDPHALVLETVESARVGYCPRYLNQGLRSIRQRAALDLTVEKVNPDAPLQFRLLCKTAFKQPEGFELYATQEHRLLAHERTPHKAMAA
ncbi:MAG: HIRAN domain-containing protein [Candidatus Kentron sp. G]|nr:MAG: HIRAN domain-containing protein [Candidatus Kentron sp. G]VFM97784.1 MAG: HIRAN domain-containing protein [Candidatus Kentron sp. G]VFM99259.1 MAG: HIRAN domain-containing protein [Candidatus Kentron sp. G]